MAVRLKDKVAIVAGGGGGIGAEICRRFAEEGANVICADRSTERGNAVVARVRSLGGAAGFHHLDAASQPSWRKLVDDVVGEHGRIDVLVTAFYSGPAGSIDDMSLEAWEACFRATSAGVFLGMNAACQVMTEGAAIVNIASVVAHGGAAFNIGYASAKAAVIAMSRDAAARLAERNIRVNIVTPGLIQTPALDAMLAALSSEARPVEQVRAAYDRKVPLKRVGQPVDVANAVLFLASSEASYVTGAELLVDGGMRTA